MAPGHARAPNLKITLYAVVRGLRLIQGRFEGCRRARELVFNEISVVLKFYSRLCLLYLQKRFGEEARIVAGSA
jgi:hypothetical protein